jgi:hypothetical protein
VRIFLGLNPRNFGEIPKGRGMNTLFSVMKKILVIFLILSLSGCVTESKKNIYLANLADAYDKRENLDGYTQSQIISKFGKPSSQETSPLYNIRKDEWSYKNLYANMKINFINGVVTGVDYY